MALGSDDEQAEFEAARVGDWCDPCSGWQAARLAVRSDADLCRRRGAREGQADRRAARPGSLVRRYRRRAGRRATYAGEADPYKHGRVTGAAQRAVDGPEAKLSRPLEVCPSRQAGRVDLASSRWSRASVARHPQGRSRGHSRPDGDRRADHWRPGRPGYSGISLDGQGLRGDDSSRLPPSPTTPRARW